MCRMEAEDRPMGLTLKGKMKLNQRDSSLLTQLPKKNLSGKESKHRFKEKDNIKVCKLSCKPCASNPLVEAHG